MVEEEICPSCGECLLEEDYEDLEDMSDGQQANYLAGFEHSFSCRACGYSTFRDVDMAEPDFEDIPSEYYLNALNGIKEIKKAVNNFELLESLEQNDFFIRLFYINTITIMETYLGDALKYNVLNDYDFMKEFILKYKPFNNEIKFTLPQILIKTEEKEIEDIYDFMRGEVSKELNELMYHNLPKVKSLYKIVFDINFPEDLSILIKGVMNRHDLVHRNGKDKDGNDITITLEMLNQLVDNVNSLIEDIESQLEVIRE